MGRELQSPVVLLQFESLLTMQCGGHFRPDKDNTLYHSTLWKGMSTYLSVDGHHLDSFTVIFTYSKEHSPF